MDDGGKDDHQPGLLASDKDIKKQEIEIQLLNYQKRFRSSIDNEETFSDYEREKWENTERDYFCLLQREGLSYPALVQKILSLRQKVKESENKYIWIVKGKQLMDEERALKEIAHWRRQLQRVEKLYFIVRSKQLQWIISTDDCDQMHYSKYSDEDLLEMILSRKMDLMRLEDEYLELLETTKTYTSDQNLQYSEEVLRRAVISRREYLVLEGECYKLLVHASSVKNVNGSLSDSDKDIYRSLKQRVTRILTLRKEVRLLEDAYLFILQVRYGNSLDSSSSSDIVIIHSQYFLEHITITLLRWRNDLRMLEDRILQGSSNMPGLTSFTNYMPTYKEISSPSHSSTKKMITYTNIFPSTMENIVRSSERMKEKEERYCKLVQEAYLIMHGNITSIEAIGQIHPKDLNPWVIYEIFATLREMMRESILAREYKWRMFQVEYDLCPMEDIDTWRGKLCPIESELFYELGPNFFTHSRSPAFERFFYDEEDIGGGEYVTWSYNSTSQGERSITIDIPLDGSNSNIVQQTNIGKEKGVHNSTILGGLVGSITSLVGSITSLVTVNDPTALADNFSENENLSSTDFFTTHVSGSVGIPTQTSSTSISRDDNENCSHRTAHNQISKPADPKAGNSRGGIADHVAPQNNMVRITRKEIEKSIVVGGLFESITSLVIVTSASSANLLDGNIVALALTNLFTGLFLIRHNLPRPRWMNNKSNVETDEVGRWNHYKEKLKEKMHGLLHFTIAFLSFIFFGLVPPFVYALFLFYNIGNKELKLVATAGASLSCTSFLAIQKAHIGRPKNRLVYIKTTTIYVCIGIGAFALSYSAGYMFGQLANKLP